MSVTKHRHAGRRRETCQERTLVDRLREGDPDALAELAARYRSKIYYLALRHTRTPEDAEEVAQDVLFKISRRIPGFRGDSALSTWIYRITFNVSMSRIRKQTSPFALASPFSALSGAERRRCHDVADSSPLPDEQLLRAEMRRQWAEALRGLPTVSRLPVVLRDVYNFSTREASAILRVNRSTLKSRLHRGHRALRKALAQCAP